MAREVTVGTDGLATGVTYVDKKTGADKHVKARVVVLAASALRIRAPAAQLEVVAVPARARQLQRRRRQVLTDTTGTDVAGFHPRDGGSRRRTTKTASAACTSTCRGGSTTRSSTSRAATTSRSGADCGMPGYGFMGGIAELPGGRRLRRVAQGRLPQVLRRDDRLLRPRRDDPQRRLATARSIPRRGPVGHSGAALPLEVDRPRVQPGEAHAGDVPLAHRARWAARCSSPMPTKEQGYGIAAGGQIIHELGCVQHGQRSDELGAQRELPGARLQEPLRRRRRPVRLAGRQEPDVDDPRARVAHRPTTSRSSARQGAVSDIDRRDALKAAWRRSRSRGVLDWSRAAASSAPRAHSSRASRRRRRMPRRTCRSSSRAHEWQTVRMLADIIIPKDERSGSATDAKAPEFMDFMLAEKDTSEATAECAMRGGLAWLDSEMRRRGSGRTSSRATDAAAARGARRHRVAEEGEAGACAAGVAFFNRFRDLTSAPRSSRARWAARICATWATCSTPAGTAARPRRLAKLGVSTTT